MKIHHFGFLTKDISSSIEDFKKLGFIQETQLVNDYSRGVNIVFMLSVNKERIELISPNQPNSIVSKILPKLKNTFYHLCFLTKNIYEKINELESEGFILIDSPKPSIALNNKNVAFLLSSSTGIIELLEE